MNVPVLNSDCRLADRELELDSTPGHVHEALVGYTVTGGTWSLRLVLTSAGWWDPKHSSTCVHTRTPRIGKARLQMEDWDGSSIAQVRRTARR